MCSHCRFSAPSGPSGSACLGFAGLLELPVSQEPRPGPHGSPVGRGLPG
uniref:Uncharacterized protein n=1 Tax=Streptomyces atratus TaxID=1893 RepID=A0A224AVC7_STRAR|nr:hypothetical protein [Streptomyces atratus]